MPKGVVFDREIDFNQLRDRLQKEIDTRFPCPVVANQPACGNYIRALKAAYVVFEQNGELFKCDYTLTGDVLTLSDKEKVTETYIAAESFVTKGAESDAINGELKAEQLSDNGYKWKLQLVQSGPTLSKNVDLTPWGYPGQTARRDYSAEALIQGVAEGLFNDVPFVVRSENDHLSVSNGTSRTLGIKAPTLKPNDEVRRIGGVTRDAIATRAGESVAVQATLDLRKNAVGKAFRKFLLDRAAEGQSIPYEVSCTFELENELKNPLSSNPTIEVTRIVQVDSVDPVMKGNAGGKIFAAAEAALTTQNMPENNILHGLYAALMVVKPKGLNLKAAEAATGDGGDTAPPDNLDAVVAQLFLDNNPAVAQMFDSPDEFAKSPKFLSAVSKWLTDSLKSAPAETPDENPDASAAAEAARKAAEAAKNTNSLNKAAEATLNEVKTILEQHKIQSTQDYVAAAVRNEPVPLQKRVVEMFKGKAAEASVVDAQIRDLKTLAAEMNPAGRFNGTVVVEEDKDKLQRQVDAFFFHRLGINAGAEAKKEFGYDPKERQYIRPEWQRSFKRMWENINGLDDIGSDMYHDSRGRAAEAFTSTAATSILGDAMHRAMLSEYRGLVQFDSWRKIADVVSVSDFKANHFLNDGYIGSLSTVTGTNDFTEIDLSSTEDTTLTVGRYGNLFTIGFEDIKNDDVNRIQRIPGKLARAAKRQLYETVMDILPGGFTSTYSPDSATYISNTHKNLIGTPEGTDALLTADNVFVGRKQLAVQQELGTNKPMGLQPKYLLFSSQDAKNGYDVTRAGSGLYNDVPSYVQSLSMEPIEVPHWTAKHFFMVADPADCPSIKVGFLDGREEPEIVQEAANTGKNFTAQVVRFRANFNWAAAKSDFRGIQGAKHS